MFTDETAHGVTSLGPEQASASELLRLNRGRREIENRLYCVRDVSCDEDGNRVRAKRLRRNLACLANAAQQFPPTMQSRSFRVEYPGKLTMQALDRS